MSNERYERYVVAFPILGDDSKKALASLARGIQVNSDMMFVRDHNIVVSPSFRTERRVALNLDTALAESDLVPNYGNFRLDNLELLSGTDGDTLYYTVVCRRQTKEKLEDFRNGLLKHKNLSFRGSDTEPTKPYITLCQGRNLSTSVWIHDSIHRNNRRKEKENGPDWFGGIVPCIYVLSGGTWVRLSET